MEETLVELTEAWITSKIIEQEANRERLSIEARILELCKDKIVEKGTTNLSTGLKVATGFTERWDQESLNYMYDTFTDDERKRFPFKREFKPSNEKIKILKEDVTAGGLWDFISKSLTISPSKPSFSYMEKK